MLKFLNKMPNMKYAEMLHQQDLVGFLLSQLKWLRMGDVGEYHDTTLLCTKLKWLKMGDVGEYYTIFHHWIQQ